MCFRNRWIGPALVGFGVGMLIACHFVSVFWCSLFGLAAVFGGICCVPRNKA